MERHNFALFTEGPIIRTHERLHITIDHRGRIFFNTLACNALGKPEGVALLFDEEKQATAFCRQSWRKAKPIG